jgi:hypothetical protein
MGGVREQVRMRRSRELRLSQWTWPRMVCAYENSKARTPIIHVVRVNLRGTFQSLVHLVRFNL